MSAARAPGLAADLAAAIAKRRNELHPIDSARELVSRYRADPAGFCREVLGFEPWSRQCEIIEAPCRFKRVSVVSGHKVGKSTALAAIALWFYCSFPGARVVITATTDRQVNGIIWREVRRLVRNALIPIPGVLHTMAHSGLKDDADFSEIVGYTAKDAEAIAGVSAGYLLYLVDEASGVAQHIFDAIEGNRAVGQAWIFLISNPTQAVGEFYDSHHSKALDTSDPEATGYYTIHIDSRESPNVTGEWRTLLEWDRKAEQWRTRTEPVPGLADPGWCAEKLREWGPESPLFLVRVAGKFVAAEESRAFAVGLISEAHERWPATDPTGRLWIGDDPAGEGNGGDEHGFCARRGCKVLELRARRGLTATGNLAELLDLINAWPAGPREALPVVVLDSEGEVGWRVYCVLKEHAASPGARFVLARVRTSENPKRRPQDYQSLRDEIAGNARDWLREGGALPENAKLEKDLAAYRFDAGTKGRLKLNSKDEMRELLGRSPDLGDAFMLSCWEPRSLRTEDGAEAPRPAARTIHVEVAHTAASVYDSLSPWR